MGEASSPAGRMARRGRAGTRSLLVWAVTRTSQRRGRGWIGWMDRRSCSRCSRYPQATARGTTSVARPRRVSTGFGGAGVSDRQKPNEHWEGLHVQHNRTGVCVSSSPMAGPCSISPQRSSRQLSQIVGWTRNLQDQPGLLERSFFKTSSFSILQNGPSSSGTNGTRIQHA